MADISIRRAVKHYGKTAIVHGIDLEIASGEFIVILGPSGCGKSTLLRMIAGLEEITGGEIAIAGKVVNRLEPRERGCAMVFQNYALYPHMTVAENIGYALKVQGMRKAERVAKVRAVAETLALEPYLDRKPAALSGGQRQRVAMGRAMIREPEVFLFDEPLSNLDAKLRVHMRIEIRKLHNRLRATSIFVTHDQVEAMTLADRIVLLNGGRIEQVGAPAELYAKPASRFVAGFIGSPPMNLIDGAVVDATTLGFAGGITVATRPHGLPAGHKVTLGIRPEDVAIGADPAAFRLEAHFVEQLGSHALAHGRFAGQDLVVQTPPTVGRAVPEAYDVTLPPAALHLFDGETGRRIEFAPATTAAGVLAPTA